MNLLEISDFWSCVDVGEDKDCWPWRGLAHGYGSYRIKSEKRIVRAHRLAYEVVNGPIRKGHVVRHRCDNPPCCNPRHLQQGTFKDNSVDCVERGRSRPGAARAKDAANPPPRSLNEKAAFAALKHGLLPIAIVAERAGVSRATAFRWAKKVGVTPATKAQAEDALWEKAVAEAKKERD